MNVFTIFLIEAMFSRLVMLFIGLGQNKRARWVGDYESYKTWTGV